MMDQEYNYTEWQRERYDGIAPDELLREAIEFELSYPVVGQSPDKVFDRSRGK